jgi:hypothetical protein
MLRNWPEAIKLEHVVTTSGPNPGVSSLGTGAVAAGAVLLFGSGRRIRTDILHRRKRGVVPFGRAPRS